MVTQQARNRRKPSRKLAVLNIRSVKHLCRHLKTDPQKLGRITANPSLYYRQWSKPDKKGKPRDYACPLGRLRAIVDNLQKLLQRVQLPDCVHGGLKGKSTRTNASVHTHKPMLLNFDIEQCFPSIRPSMVYRMFCDRLACSPDVARLLTRLTTLNNQLPQGSPTSVIVAALVLEPLVLRIDGLAKQHGANFSQYVDDGAISGPDHVEKLRGLVIKIVRQSGFRASDRKTVAHRHGVEQIVTGIKVNFGFDVPPEKLAEVCHQIEEFRTPTIQTDLPRALSSLEGRLRYIESLNKGAGRHYRQRLARTLRTPDA